MVYTIISEQKNIIQLNMLYSLFPYKIYDDWN